MSPRPTSTPELWVPDEARAQWDTLGEALADVVTPCQRQPIHWQTDHPLARERAALGCAGCPVFSVCGAYASAADEEHGIWAGVDRTPRTTAREAS